MRTFMIAAAMLGAVALAAGADPVEAKKKAPDPAEAKKAPEPVPPQITVDAREVAAVAAGMKDRIKGSPETLKKESEKLLREVQTELQYGRAIAVLEARVDLLQKAHLEYQLRAQDSAAERRNMGKDLEGELARIKEQYRSNPEIAEQLQVELIVNCRDTLRAMKAEEDACVKQSADTFRQLLALKLERAKARAPVILKDLPPLPPLPATAAKPAADPKTPRETLPDAKKSIEHLIK
jgi:hypothetical protein